MARPHSHEEVSAYYPPRARWYAGIYYPLGAVRRQLDLDRFSLPGEIRLTELIAGFLVPGLAVWFRRRNWIGRAALAAAAVLPLIFLAGLGYRVGNIAFGLLLSLHVTGVLFYCNPILVHEPFPQRLATTVLILLLMGLGLYMPVRLWVQGHLFMPLVLNGHVLVTQRSNAFNRVHRGDWVAYNLLADETGDPHRGGEIRITHGLGLGPVLAVPGDEVAFSNGVFAVNGVSHPTRPHMPVSGGLTVGENHWFIWPDFAISGHGNTAEATLSEAMMSIANVNVDQYRGHPFHSWFGRPQILP